jgi:hypothetical protein
LGQEGDDVREPLYYSLSAELEGKDSAAMGLFFIFQLGTTRFQKIRDESKKEERK